MMNTQSGLIFNSQNMLSVLGQTPTQFNNLQPQNIMTLCGQPTIIGNLPTQAITAQSNSFIGGLAGVSGQNLMNITFNAQPRIVGGQTTALISTVPINSTVPMNSLPTAGIGQNLQAVGSQIFTGIPNQQSLGLVNSGLVGLQGQPVLLGQSNFTETTACLPTISSFPNQNLAVQNPILFGSNVANVNPISNLTTLMPNTTNLANRDDAALEKTSNLVDSIGTSNRAVSNPVLSIQSSSVYKSFNKGEYDTSDKSKVKILESKELISKSVSQAVEPMTPALDWDVESKMVDDADDVKSIEEGDVDDDDDVVMASSEDMSTNTNMFERFEVERGDELEFNWEEYLETDGAVSAPHTAFKHVECSLQSGFVKGMKLEVSNKSCVGTYWVASVVMNCGPLLRLRYEGFEDDSSADFWHDLSTAEIHPIGWCAHNGQLLEPPEAIKDKYEDWAEFLVTVLTGARTAPEYLLKKGTGSTPVDQLTVGMYVEILRTECPKKMWIAKVLENVGGRLYLRYEGAVNSDHDLWLFYLDSRVHPVGWGCVQGYTFEAPPEIVGGRTEKEMTDILHSALGEAKNILFPVDIMKDQVCVIDHNFQVGWKLEAVHPVSRNVICPATVKEIIDSVYFIIEIDDLTNSQAPVLTCCHSLSPLIFPVRWCSDNGLKLLPPKGWSKQDFVWSEYLEHTNSLPAPESAFLLENTDHEFDKGMKLEAVNIHQPDQICVATIVKVVGRLLWIHLDSSEDQNSSHIEDVDSLDIFPVGWCESNGYHLKPPRSLAIKGVRRVAVVQPELSATSTCHRSSLTDSGTSKSWCPKIFFNHRCFSGPYLSKGRIAELPKSVGPGPMLLVMKEVLSMLISVAYKSCHVLRELQLMSRSNPNMQQEILKAKYKNKSYRAVVSICKSSDQLDDYLNSISLKLECCPNLISPHVMRYPCPHNCSQLSKAKYNYYYGKIKRKIGRPPSSHTNIMDSYKKKRRRRHRKKIHFVHRKNRGVGSQGPPITGTSEKAPPPLGTIRLVKKPLIVRDKTSQSVIGGQFTVKQRKHRIPPPPSDIQTRGANKPKFTFERKTHKKILVPLSASTAPTSNASISTPQLADQHDAGGLTLSTNPLTWSVAKVVEFIRSTDCCHLASLFNEQEIDGQAFLLLTLPTVQEHLQLKLGPAIKLCHIVEKVKVVFFDRYA